MLPRWGVRKKKERKDAQRRPKEQKMRYLISFLVAFAASALIGRFLIPWLHALKAWQSIKEIGPVWHMA